MKYKPGTCVQINTDVKNKSVAGVIGIVVDVSGNNNTLAVMLPNPAMSKWEILTADDDQVTEIGPAAFMPTMIHASVARLKDDEKN